MKTLPTLQSTRDAIIASNASGKITDKEKRAAKRLMPTLNTAIRLLEQGMTEEVLRKELATVMKTISIYNYRLTHTLDGKEKEVNKVERELWEKKCGYTDMRRQMKLIKYMLL